MHKHNFCMGLEPAQQLTELNAELPLSFRFSAWLAFAELRDICNDAKDHVGIVLYFAVENLILLQKASSHCCRDEATGAHKIKVHNPLFL